MDEDSELPEPTSKWSMGRVLDVLVVLTPTWFQILEWMTLVAVVKVVSDRTASVSMFVLYISSAIILALYICWRVVSYAFDKAYDMVSDNNMFILLIVIIIAGLALSVAVQFSILTAVDQLTKQF